MRVLLLEEILEITYNKSSFLMEMGIFGKREVFTKLWPAGVLKAVSRTSNISTPFLGRRTVISTWKFPKRFLELEPITFKGGELKANNQLKIGPI